MQEEKRDPNIIQEIKNIITAFFKDFFILKFAGIIQDFFVLQPIKCKGHCIGVYAPCTLFKHDAHL